MKIARALLVGASLLAPGAWAGEVSNITGTLDTTLVDPAPSQYPHFICASGCGGGGNNFNGAVTQSGSWSVGVSNFPTNQTVSGTVSIGNFPTNQTVSGTVSVGNFPATQAVTGSVSVANLPAVQAVSASSLPLPAGAATAANQPVLNSDGGGLAHVTNFPAVQSVTGSVAVSASIPYGGNHVGSVAIDVPLPGFSTPPTVNVGNANLPVTGAAGAFSDGWNPTEGTTADPAWTSGSGSMVSLLKALVQASGGPTPAGSYNIGFVGVTPTAGFSYPTLTNHCYAYATPTTLFSLAGLAPTGALNVEIFNTSSKPADGSFISSLAWYFPVSTGGWSYAFHTPLQLSAGATVCYSSSSDPNALTTATGLSGTERLMEQHS